MDRDLCDPFRAAFYYLPRFAHNL